MLSTFEQILKDQGVLVYTIKGVSMFPLLRQHRDLICVLPHEGRLKRYDVPLFKRDNGEYVVHRVLKVLPDGYGISGDNQSFIEFVREYQIIGIVDKIERNGKTIPLRSTPEHPVVPLKYRIYTHLWCDFFPVRAFFVKVEFRLRSWFK